MNKTINNSFIVKKGSYVWRYERAINPNPQKHFFIDYVDDALGVRQVGFKDPQGYHLVKYKVLKDVEVLETYIKEGYLQLTSGTLQNVIEQVGKPILAH